MRRAEARDRLLVAGAALAAYATSLLARGWPRDDRWLILEHPLIRAGWGQAWRLLSSGYVQPVLGARTPIHEWRPVLSLTFLLQRLATGFAPLPFHAVNLLLHAAAAALVFEVLRRRLSARAALAGALFWAVLPVHAEVVAYITSRSEQLALLAVLGSWLLAGAGRPSGRRIAAAALVYALGSLSKETALLFPAFLMLADWTFDGTVPWSRERRPTYLALGLSGASVLAGRSAVLPALAHGGAPYFSATPPLERLLTLARYWTASYAVPALTGTGLCADFARPLVPDSGPGDLAAWACLAGVCALLVSAAVAAARRRAWGFWVLGPLLFLLPTSHLLMDLDTLGAQRFLYLPALGLAAGAGALFAAAEKRRPVAARALLAAVVLALGARSAVRALDWRDDAAYYRAAASCNPVSAKTRAGLALAELRAGDLAAGDADLREAVRLDPELYDPVVNLAKRAYDRGDWKAARALSDRALALAPAASEALVLAALLDERDGQARSAARRLSLAVAYNPDDATARFDYARLLAAGGLNGPAAVQLRAYLRLTPPGKDRDEAQAWLERLLSGR